MAKDRLSGKLAVILHADVAGSTELVKQDEQLAHKRIQDTFRRLSSTIDKYRGHVLELRGDALLAEFGHSIDAVCAALSFQLDQDIYNDRIEDNLRPNVRVGIAMGEVIVANGTVTGSGVVQAQRVEQLAEPGGACITAAIREALSQRLPIDLRSLGEQTLKGFDYPVRIYRVESRCGESIPLPEKSRTQLVPPRKQRLLLALIVIALVVTGAATYWFNSWLPQVEPASVDRMAFQLPDKPSIAVLPFISMSDDTQQSYFADGITEDLITDISKVSGLFVIARNSVFTYKGRAVSVRQVAEELGVRYVMEGSVRRAGNQVRVNAQLIDATTGGHVWADRYDGSLNDVFAIQDQITQNIANALAVALTDEEQTKLVKIETNSPEAYDVFLRGWEHYRRDTPGDYAKARSYFEQAIQLDPEYARAQSALAAVYWNSAWRYWVEGSGLSTPQIMDRARIHLHKAMRSPSALTHQIASERAAYFSPNPDRALAEAEIAIALDANDPAGHYAMANALLKARRPDQAIESMRRAMRLDPQYPSSYLTRLGRAEFELGQYQKAAVTLERATGLNAQDDRAFVYLAATYGHLGRLEEANSAVEKVNILRKARRWGEITLEDIRNWNWIGDRQRLREGLTKAGVATGYEWYSRVSGVGKETEVEGAIKISAEKAKQLHESGVPFVDISQIYVQRRIPGAHNLVWIRDRLSLGPREFNESRLLEIADKSQSVVIYHTNSNEQFTAYASAYAVEHGFQKVYYFASGLDGWIAAGYPIYTR